MKDPLILLDGTPELPQPSISKRVSKSIKI